MLQALGSTPRNEKGKTLYQLIRTTNLLTSTMLIQLCRYLNIFIIQWTVARTMPQPICDCTWKGFWEVRWRHCRPLSLSIPSITWASLRSCTLFPSTLSPCIHFLLLQKKLKNRKKKKTTGFTKVIKVWSGRKEKKIEIRDANTKAKYFYYVGSRGSTT